VVVAIVALLIALLLPALNKARDAARAVVCMSNLRQCDIGVRSYAIENQGDYPATRTRGGNIRLWTWFLAGGYSTDDTQGATRYLTRKVVICPSNRYYTKDLQIDGGSNIGYGLFLPKGDNGSQKVFRTTFCKLQRSVDISDRIGQPPGTWRVNFQNDQWLPTSPGRTVRMADSMTDHPSTTDGGGHMMANFVDQSISNWNGAVHLLHSDRANLLFFDGHVEAMTDDMARDDTESRIRYFYDAGGLRYPIGPALP
jgi:prepilin-type processing-associated H-X9-DG protein